MLTPTLANTWRWIDRTWPTAMAAGLVALLVPLFMWDPATSGLFPLCPFRALTGFHCPGCGSLRATHRLLHGEFAAAFRMNSLAVIVLPLLAYAVASARWRWLRFAWIDRVTSQAAWPQFILAVVVLHWGLRNVPLAPFEWLAPH